MFTHILCPNDLKERALLALRKGGSNCPPVQFENHDAECPPRVYGAARAGNASGQF